MNDKCLSLRQKIQIFANVFEVCPKFLNLSKILEIFERLLYAQEPVSKSLPFSDSMSEAYLPFQVACQGIKCAALGDRCPHDASYLKVEVPI